MAPGRNNITNKYQISKLKADCSFKQSVQYGHINIHALLLQESHKNWQCRVVSSFNWRPCVQYYTVYRYAVCDKWRICKGTTKQINTTTMHDEIIKHAQNTVKINWNHHKSITHPLSSKHTLFPPSSRKKSLRSHITRKAESTSECRLHLSTDSALTLAKLNKKYHHN